MGAANIAQHGAFVKLAEATKIDARRYAQWLCPTLDAEDDLLCRTGMVALSQFRKFYGKTPNEFLAWFCGIMRNIHREDGRGKDALDKKPKNDGFADIPDPDWRKPFDNIEEGRDPWDDGNDELCEAEVEEILDSIAGKLRHRTKDFGA